MDRMGLTACASAADWTDVDGEQSLIERARHDRRAFAVLYRRHYAAVAGYLYRRTGDVHVTEDLVADVFVSALRAMPRYRQRGRPFRNWLYAIATNAANRWARRRRRWFHEPLNDQTATAAEEDRHHAAGEAQQALLALSPKHQAVLTLHHVEGLRVEEVAAILGCRVGTVKSRLSRARAQLRARLEKRR